MTAHGISAVWARLQDRSDKENLLVEAIGLHSLNLANATGLTSSALRRITRQLLVAFKILFDHEQAYFVSREFPAARATPTTTVPTVISRGFCFRAVIYILHLATLIDTPERLGANDYAALRQLFLTTFLSAFRVLCLYQGPLGLEQAEAPQLVRQRIVELRDFWDSQQRLSPIEFLILGDFVPAALNEIERNELDGFVTRFACGRFNSAVYHPGRIPFCINPSSPHCRVNSLRSSMECFHAILAGINESNGAGAFWTLHDVAWATVDASVRSYIYQKDGMQSPDWNLVANSGVSLFEAAKAALSSLDPRSSAYSICGYYKDAITHLSEPSQLLFPAGVARTDLTRRDLSDGVHDFYKLLVARDQVLSSQHVTGPGTTVPVIPVHYFPGMQREPAVHAPIIQSPTPEAVVHGDPTPQVIEAPLAIHAQFGQDGPPVDEPPAAGIAAQMPISQQFGASVEPPSRPPSTRYYPPTRETAYSNTTGRFSPSSPGLTHTQRARTPLGAPGPSLLYQNSSPLLESSSPAAVPWPTRIAEYKYSSPHTDGASSAAPSLILSGTSLSPVSDWSPRSPRQDPGLIETPSSPTPSHHITTTIQSFRDLSSPVLPPSHIVIDSGLQVVEPGMIPARAFSQKVVDDDDADLDLAPLPRLQTHSPSISGSSLASSKGKTGLFSRFSKSKAPDKDQVTPEDLCFRFSATGTNLLLWRKKSPDHIVKLVWPFQDGQKLSLRSSSPGQFQAEDESISVRLVEGGRRLVAAVVFRGRSGRLVCFDGQGARTEAALEHSRSAPLALAVSRNDAKVVVCYGTTIHLYDLTSGAPRMRSHLSAHPQASRYALNNRRTQRASFSVDSKRLVVATQEFDNAHHLVYITQWDLTAADPRVEVEMDPVILKSLGYGVNDTGLSGVCCAIDDTEPANSRVFLAVAATKPHPAILTVTRPQRNKHLELGSGDRSIDALAQAPGPGGGTQVAFRNGRHRVFTVDVRNGQGREAHNFATERVGLKVECEAMTVGLPREDLVVVFWRAANGDLVLRQVEMAEGHCTVRMMELKDVYLRVSRQYM